MFRILIGSVLGGIAQFLIGALFWGTPLGRLAFRHLDEVNTADLHVALARTLTQSGTGTYVVPVPETAAGTALLARGPVAMIFFNTNGFPPMGWANLMAGLVVSIVMLLLAGVGLSLVDGTAARIKAALLMAVATILYFVLGTPIYYPFMPWGYWVWSALIDFVGFATGVHVLIRWFMPAAPVTPRAG
jgi:hypothetical protein